MRATKDLNVICAVCCSGRDLNTNLLVNIPFALSIMAGSIPADGSSNLPRATKRLYLISTSPFLYARTMGILEHVYDFLQNTRFMLGAPA